MRPNIWGLKPYHCARDDYTEGVLLDANENAYGAPVPNNDTLERYPCPYQWGIREQVGKIRGVDKEEVFVGVGSDEAIDMVIRIFCVPGHDKICQCSPTYGMYAVSAATNDVGVVDVPLTTDFQLDLPGLQQAVASEPIKVMFLCSPGNPSCVQLKRADLITVLQDQSYRGIVVVDEAYIDFAGPGASVCELIREYPHLVVMQTMSKAWGLAGIRCGFAISAAPTIAIMNKVKAPYSVNKLTSSMALEALRSQEVFQQKLEQVLAERDRLRERLESMVGVVHRVLPSDANFLMFQIDNAEAVYKSMAEGGVVVRYRGSCLHCDGCLRVTVGTPEENETFLKMLEAETAR